MFLWSTCKIVFYPYAILNDFWVIKQGLHKLEKPGIKKYTVQTWKDGQNKETKKKKCQKPGKSA